MHLNRAAEAGALSASFAHDLGQPLVAISLNAQMVEERLKDRPELSHLMRAVADIRNANEHAVGIIKKFRKLLKRQSDHDVQETDINAVIADAVSILSSEANRRQVVLRVEGVPGPLLVNADPVHLLQVLLNLATNALDAMADTAPDARNITIRTTLVGGAQVEVSVVDSGPGIPEEKLATVFDTFYTTKEHGTGLGLSIARTIVDAYGGTIWAENLAGSGAAFRLTLLLIQDSWSRTVRLPPSGKCTNSDAALRGRAR